MSGVSASGSVSQSYVTDAVKASGISDLTPLPAEYFSLSDPERMVVRSGRHTATVTVKADERFLADPHASPLPYYALAFRIAEADADVVPLEKSFAVIAVRYENMLFGNYWHGGVTTVKNDATGEVVEKNEYPLEIPHDDSRVYTLTTVAPDGADHFAVGRLGRFAAADAPRRRRARRCLGRRTVCDRTFRRRMLFQPCEAGCRTAGCF